MDFHNATFPDDSDTLIRIYYGKNFIDIFIIDKSHIIRDRLKRIGSYDNIHIECPSKLPDNIFKRFVPEAIFVVLPGFIFIDPERMPGQHSGPLVKNEHFSRGKHSFLFLSGIGTAAE